MPGKDNRVCLFYQDGKAVKINTVVFVLNTKFTGCHYSAE